MKTFTVKHVLLTTAVICFATGLTIAQERPAKQTPGADADSPAKKYFTDVLLVNQDGQKMPQEIHGAR